MVNYHLRKLRKYYEIKSVWKEVNNFDTYQCTKRSNIKYGKLLAKKAEKISRNKLCVYLIGPYDVWRKVHK